MTQVDNSVPSSFLVPGEVLALLSPLQELEPGLYLVDIIQDGWAVLRMVIDDEENEQVLVTNRQVTLPVPLLELFLPVGLRLSFTV
jgi:hypothetical protein